MSVPIGNGRLKHCHATAVARHWVLTAAHCFSQVSSGARGNLEQFDRGFSMLDVQYHPSAFRAEAPALDGRWDESDIAVADDLAVIHLDAPLSLAFPSIANRQEFEAALAASSSEVSFSRQDLEDNSQTAFAIILGEIPAADLVGPGHQGHLLSATSDGVYPGGSGAGVVIAGSVPLNALPPDPESTDRLIGVVQNANREDPSLSFGIVPLYNSDTFQWLQQLRAN